MSDSTNPYAPVSDTNDQVALADVPRLEPPVTVRYCYTPELLAALWTHRTLTSQSDTRLRRKYARNFMVLGLVPAVFFAWATWEEQVPIWIALPGIAFFTAIAALGIQYRRASNVHTANTQMAHRLMDETPNEHFLSQRELTIDTDGVRQAMPASDSFTRWSAFERIDHDDHYAYLFDSSVSALVVPRTAFVTRAQFLGFVELARRLWQGQTESSSQKTI